MSGAIIGHLVGDYLLQNDWMAAGKKRSSFICAVHCAIWTACVMVFADWHSPIAAGVLFVTHFAQDRTAFVRWYMKAAGQTEFAKPPMAPWSMIAVDNTLHLVVIYFVAMVQR